MYVCILDAAGQVLVHRNVKSSAETFLEIVAPYREDRVVAAECMFTWYWVADLCAAEDSTYVLGHALAMKAIHGGQAKNDTIDSQKIAALRRGGLVPQAYVYPAAMRSTRDLLRRSAAPGAEARAAAGPHPEHASSISTPRVRASAGRSGEARRRERALRGSHRPQEH